MYSSIFKEVIQTTGTGPDSLSWKKIDGAVPEVSPWLSQIADSSSGTSGEVMKEDFEYIWDGVSKIQDGPDTGTQIMKRINGVPQWVEE
jgi:hypothetical protein